MNTENLKKLSQSIGILCIFMYRAGLLESYRKSYSSRWKNKSQSRGSLVNKISLKMKNILCCLKKNAD